MYDSRVKLILESNAAGNYEKSNIALNLAIEQTVDRMLLDPVKFRREAPLAKDKLILHPTKLSDLGDLIYTMAWYHSRDANFGARYKWYAGKIVESNREADKDVIEATNMALKRMEKNPKKWALHKALPFD